MEAKKLSSFEILNGELSFETEARSNPMLLFYQFNCPQCGELNTISKDYKSQVSRCSNGGCRRIVIITNIDQIK